MATIGQQLLAPESGWRRYDDTNPLIEYKGTWGTDANTGYYGGTYRASNTIGSQIKICFYGTKIRVIADYYTNKPSIILITIDGVEQTYSQYGTTAIQKALVFEKTGLKKGYHTVIVTVKQATVWTSIDAIDIDDDGELRFPHEKVLLKSNNKVYSLKPNELHQLPKDSIQNFINYGSSSIDNFNTIHSNKKYILSDDVSEDTDGLWKQELNRKPLSIKFE